MSAVAGLRVFVGLLALLSSACAGHSSGLALTDVQKCNLAVLEASQASLGLAMQRENEMKVMRFGSEAAINAYVTETDRLKTEAVRLDAVRLLLVKKGGDLPGDVAIIAGGLTHEQATSLIAAADACTDEALK